MIQPNELRIGNYVLDEGQVHEIILYDFYNYHEDSGITNQEPIPLTEEWLLKLGFKYQKGFVNDSYYYLNGLNLATGFQPICKPGALSIKYTLQYVHQLQNLYFALTGEELKIKELV